MTVWLLDPLSYEFMRNALLVGILAGVLCPVVGTYLIVQRMALLGDVIALTIFAMFWLALLFSPNQGILLSLWFRQRSRPSDLQDK
jgi:manganese/iron transport system permease protein